MNEIVGKQLETLSEKQDNSDSTRVEEANAVRGLTFQATVGGSVNSAPSSFDFWSMRKRQWREKHS